MLLQANSGKLPKPAPKGEPHAVRGTVPPHEKLLLIAILVVVAAWILFRVALMPFAMYG